MSKWLVGVDGANPQLGKMKSDERASRKGKTGSRIASEDKTT